MGELPHRSILESYSRVARITELADRSVYWIDELETLPAGAPIFLDNAHEQLFEGVRSVAPNTFSDVGPQRFIACLNHAIVFGPHFLVLDRQGKVLEEPYHDRSVVLSDTLRQLAARRSAGRRAVEITREVEEEVVLLACPWADAYYHWMMDALPKLILVQQHLAGRELSFLVPQLSGFHRELLARLGIPPARLLEFDGSAWRFRRLLIPSMMGHHMSTTPAVVQWLRQLFHPDESVPAAPVPVASRRLYVSRGRDSRRRVLNEEELCRALEAYGFEIVQGDSLSVQEQAALFSEARMVVAPHGGGLTNLVFTRPGALLLEMMPIDHLAFPFYNICRVGGHHYIFQLLLSENDSCDMVAPIDFIDTTVYNFLADTAR